jgi:cytochrome c553
MKPLALPAALLVLALGLCSSVLAQSQPKSKAQSTASPSQFEAFVKSVDKDGDGRITKAEAGGAKWFEFADANKDGVIDEKELATIRTGRGEPAPGRSTNQPPKAQPKTVSAAANAEDIAFFEKRIRPVLVKSCFKCHSADAKELKAGLALDARDAVLKGGDSGPAVVLGKPDESLLITSLRHSDPDLKMPPDEQGGKLADAVIADFVEWVKRGVPMPAGATASTHANWESRLSHWAFQPVTAPSTPPVKDAAWARTDVDRFVLAGLEKRGLVPVVDAEPATLLRRVYFDLTGLPPTAEEVTAFLAKADGSRLAAVVDELLKSPRFGERWGRHWLDVARFAESSGKETDIAYPHAWRYRDYVIAAFNQDKPFDQFIREQIAGDLLPANDDQTRAERFIATGFLALGPKGHGEKNPLKFEMDLADEQIDTVSQAFLGLTMACARCHDHKYDPVSQRDYYALAGIFRSTDTRFGTSPMAMNGNANAALALPRGAHVPDAVPPLNASQRRQLEQSIAGLGAKMREMAGQGRTASGEYVRTMLKKQTETARLALFEADGTPKQLAVCTLDRSEGRDSELFVRGEVDRPGAVVPRGLPSLASFGTIDESRLSLRESTSVRGANGDDPAFFRGAKGDDRGAKGDNAGSGRRELADWIASPENPLTARVIVNRVWLHLFGQGLVATPDNFGLSGQAPSNLELLDHLATRFVKQGWSIKRLIRELMLSRVYSLSTDRDAKSFEVDPDNTLLWRMTPRRLDAECIRDAMLFTAGTLELTPPVGSPIGAYGDGHVSGAQVQIGGPPDQLSKHRSVYLPVIRNSPLESLALFDMASGTVVTGQRSQTTIPAQSLYLLNSPYVLKLSEVAGQRLLADSPRGDQLRMRLAYERFFNRPPTSAETQAGLDFVKRHASAELGWAALCRAMWASHDFLSRH